MSDWSPDIIIRRREHPTTIFQSPVPADLEKTRCLYAVQLKSWYDEQYNDWAKRYLREQLYNPDGIDLGAIYAYKNLLLKPPSSKKIAPRQVAEDEEYPTTECKDEFVDFSCQEQRLPRSLNSARTCPVFNLSRFERNYCRSTSTPLDLWWALIRPEFE